MDLSNIRMVATDLDGTLLPEGTPRISQRDIEIIRRLIDSGILFAAVSGRPVSIVRRMFAPVERDIICVGDNGACICQGDRVIYEDVMDEKLCFEFIDDVQAMDDRFENLVCSRDCCASFPKRDMTIVELARDWNMPLRVVGSKEAIVDKIIKLSVYFPQGVTEEDAAYFTGKWKDRIKRISVSGSKWMDFQTADKGIGVKMAAKVMGIDLENVAAFGDNFNDVDMLDVAGVSFAMAASPEGVKKHAGHQCESVQDVMEQILAAAGK